MNSKQKENKPTLLSRRDLFLLLGGTTAASVLTGCTNVESSSTHLDKIVGCVVSPEQTAGPYFVDERLNRVDIRSNPKDKSIKSGAILNLELTILQVSNGQCKPLPDAMVDIWHCDTKGVYSDVDDYYSGDTRGQKFLRGYQMTDKKGMVKFKTIYPGWYEGRTVHIHYKVRTSPDSSSGYEHTSQLYFDESFTKDVQKLKPYSERKSPRVTNSRDGIYRRGGDKLMLDLAKKGNEYFGKFSVGIVL